MGELFTQFHEKGLTKQAFEAQRNIAIYVLRDKNEWVPMLSPSH